MDHLCGCCACIDRACHASAQDKVKAERPRQRYRGSSDSDDEDGEDSDDEEEEEQQPGEGGDDDDEDDAAMYERSYERSWERAAQAQGRGRGGGRAGRPPKPPAPAVPWEPWKEMGRGKFTPVNVRSLHLARVLAISQDNKPARLLQHEERMYHSLRSSVGHSLLLLLGMHTTGQRLHCTKWVCRPDFNSRQGAPLQRNRSLPMRQVRWAGDRCAVCDSEVDFDSDQLVSCDACALTVHQSCYGVPDLPGEDDMWLCRPCELKASPVTEPRCTVASLCPQEASAGLVVQQPAVHMPETRWAAWRAPVTEATSHRRRKGIRRRSAACAP